jgi:uroporphyrinogen-III synthase
LSPKTAETIAKAGTKVSVAEGTSAVGSMFDTAIYEVRHLATKQMVYVTAGDLHR